MSNANTSLPEGMELWFDDTGQRVVVHSEDRCSGRCPIHNQSQHHMSGWPRRWDDKNKMMSRICPHGDLHVDPQQVEFFQVLVGPDRAKKITQHHCDGCCINYIDGEVVMNVIENPRREIEG